MITNKVEYLLWALVDLAQHREQGFVTSRDVAQRRGIPPKYMPQLMAILTRKGWVESVRGSGGGVRLSADPESISVKDVIEVSDDPLIVKPCVSDKFKCDRARDCVLLPVWRRAQEELDKVMEETTIQDLVKQHRSGS